MRGVSSHPVPSLRGAEKIPAARLDRAWIILEGDLHGASEALMRRPILWKCRRARSIDQNGVWSES